MTTIRASERGLEQIHRARQRRGWCRQSESWCLEAHTSMATLRRFLSYHAIQQETFIDICQAVGITDWETIAQVDVHLCLSAMPDVPMFLGRTAELAQITDWVSQCRAIVLWGMGGIGKTSLVAECVESLIRAGTAQKKFEAIFWRSLQYDPCLETLERSLTEPFQETQILSVLQQHRILLILDNWEALLGGVSAGQVKAEFTAFGQLLQQIGTVKHKSCVIAISREKPAELASLEGINPFVRSYKLGGMGEDAIALLQHRGLREEQTAWQKLTQLYRGHPLALNMIASLIQDICQGSTTLFLQMNTIVIHQLDSVLAERTRWLAPTELEVLKTLARSRQPVSREWLQTQLDSLRGSQLLEILSSLERRCLLEILSEETVLFALAPIVQKYMDRQCLTQRSW